jgi:hypothetical protein
MVWGSLEFNELWPFQLLSKNLKVYQDSNFQSESPIRNVWVHSFTLSHTPESVGCDSSVAFPARTFPCPYFHHKPKAKVVTIFLFSMYNYYATPFFYHTFHTFINYVEMFQNKNFNSFQNFISSNLHSYKNLFSSNEGVSKGPKILIYVLAKMKLNKKFHKVLYITFTMWFIMHINLCKKLSSRSPSLNHAY